MACLQRLGIFAMSLYYGTIYSFRLLKLAVIYGPRSVFGRKTYLAPPALTNPSLGSHDFLQLDQVRIHYVASGPEDKPLMLCLHGFPEFWYSWRHQIVEFQNDYRVVAIDQRGYGESDKPQDVASYYGAILVNDIKKVVSALGYKSCVLVAHDWGGILGWGFARKFPEMVDRLIIMNAAPSPLFSELLKESKEQKKMSWYLFFFQLPCLPEVFLRACNFGFLETCFGISNPVLPELVSPMVTKVSQEELDIYKFMMSEPGTLTATINWYRAIFRQTRNDYDLNFQMPVLVIWGMKDLSLSSRIPEMIEEKAPNIAVKRIQNAGHFVQMDTPQEVNELMREWLSEQKKD